MADRMRLLRNYVVIALEMAIRKQDLVFCDQICYSLTTVYMVVSTVKCTQPKYCITLTVALTRAAIDGLSLMLSVGKSL